jgi:hypothetical protein
MKVIGVTVYQWCEFEFHRERTNNLSAQKSCFNTVGLNFQMYLRIDRNFCSVHSKYKDRVAQ